MGTAGYLSPEQAQGERATAASDRYALAVVAFELLTGTRPFEADSLTAEAMAHVQADVPSVSDRLSSLPRELDPVFQRALAKEPALRYPTCADFVADLRQALHEAAGMTRQLEPVPPAQPPPPMHSPSRRSRLPLVPTLLGLALLGLAILAATLLLRGGGETPAAQTFVRTVVKTTPGKTVTQQLTVTTPTAPTTSPTPASSGTDLAQGRRDSDAAFNLIRNGDYAGALPLAQKALAELKGTGDIYEAYANYNVGTSLIHLGRCSEGLPYLDASEQIQGARKEIRNDRKLCEKGR